MNQLTRPMPRPTAQVEPFVDALGAELAVRFLIFYGGAELYVSDDPKGRSSHEAFLGYDAAKALAAEAHRLPKRIPLAHVWLARMLARILDWQGKSTASIARTLRVTDVSVRVWLNGG